MRKPMQFSQKIACAGLFLIVLVVLGDFVLVWYDKPPLQDTTKMIIGIFGGFVTGGYFALSGVRDCSRNKYQLDGNGRPFKSDKEIINDYMKGDV